MKRLLAYIAAIGGGVALLVLIAVIVIVVLSGGSDDSNIVANPGGRSTAGGERTPDKPKGSEKERGGKPDQRNLGTAGGMDARRIDVTGGTEEEIAAGKPANRGRLPALECLAVNGDAFPPRSSTTALTQERKHWAK